MFFEYFENLRSKPVEVRKRYALFFTSACTSFVVLIWLTTIFLGNIGTRGTNEKVDVVASEEETVSDLFKDANRFIDESNGKTQGAAEYSNESWVQDLEQMDMNTSQEQYIESQNEIPQEESQATGTQSVFSL